VALTADSTPGFSTSVEQGKSRQVSIEECLVGTAELPGRMAIATIQSNRRAIEFFAFWRVDDHSWIKGFGLAGNAEDSAD